MTELYCIRHGETEWNRLQKVQGSADIPLSETGRAQAQCAAAALAGVHFDAVYSSPLLRALATAEIVGRRPASQIHFDKRLRERSFGKLEGLPYEDARVQPLFDNSVGFVPPGGESISDVRARLSPLLEEILQKEQGKRVLVATHGMALMTLRLIAANDDESHLRDVWFNNCSILKIQVQDGVLRYAVEHPLPLASGK